MHVHVQYRFRQMEVDEVFAGPDSQTVVAEMKRLVASRAGLGVRLALAAMSPLQFAQEVARRYAQATGRSVPAPASCDEFLRLGQAEGIVTVLEPRTP